MYFIDKDNTVTKFTDYAVNSPDFYIKFIQDEIKLRDVRGLTNNRITSVFVTGEHPLVTMTDQVLAGSQLDTSGILPAIAVVEDDEIESFETIGDGIRTPFALTQSFVNECRSIPIELRIQDGLLTDAQLALIEQAIANNASSSPTGEGAVLAMMEGFFLRETIFVSVWAHSTDERNIIGNVMRSILYDMKKAMKLRKLKDIHIRSAKGLVNTNFGRALKGQETTIEYINFFHNITVTKELPTKILIDNAEKISIFDTINNSIEEISTILNTDPRFKSFKDEGLVNTLEGELEDE